MAYNLESLITILQQILNPEQTHWILDDHKKPQLDSLLEKAVSLKQIHENSSVPKIESLESQIRDAAHKAEDIIETYMVDQLLSRPGGVSFTFSTPDLQQVMQEVDSAKEQVVKLMEGNKISTATSSTAASFPTDPPSKSVHVVGVDEDMLQLQDRLTRTERKLEIIPIVGMGGIGKTTLARKLYNDPLIVSNFEYRAWITISQDYNVRSILLGLLGCIIGKLSNELTEKKDHVLKDILYKNLYSRRYLIVLDDMWSTNSWKDINKCFPDCNNGSRIVITTRESDVAKYADSQGVQHQMQLLNMSESWDLLHQTVFGKDDCPDALQGIGRKIARDCGGLPLAINVIGGLLSNSERSRDGWENIAKDVRAAIADTDNKQFSNILSLSYNHMPNHLRPCFLYMGAFPEDHEIKASKLVRLWVAEGFLTSNGVKSLEEEAEDYLKALVERNLVLVREIKSNGKAKSYGIHDLLRDLCMRKAEEEKFVHVKNGRVEKVKLYRLRRVSAHTSYRLRDMYASAELMSLARSFLCIGLMSRAILSPVFFALRLLRVLDVLEMDFPHFPREIFQLVNLRYLALSCMSSTTLPSEISRLWNLQTLIVRLKGLFDLPTEIWEISELRHLKLNTPIYFANYYRKTFVQKRLHTISTVSLLYALSSGFFKTIPNIRKLGIQCIQELPYPVVDLRHLHQLETLKCFSDVSPEARRFLPSLRFPCSVRKLSLHACAMSQEFSMTLRALPSLEVLKIRKCVFESEENEAKEDQEWETTQGDEFGSLQYLLLESLNLVRWRADETNFPRLQRLVIRRCFELEGIPSGIGEIPTLQLIELDECSPSVVASANQIQQLQQSDYENYDLQLLVS